MDETTDLATIWTTAIGRFDDSVRPNQRAWLSQTRPLGLVEDTAVIAAPNEWVKDYLENRLRPLIASALSEELGRDIQVAVTVQRSDELLDGDAFDDDDEDDDETAEVIPSRHLLVERRVGVGTRETTGPSGTRRET